MFYLDNNSGVSAMPQPVAQQSAAPRWFTEGNGSAMPSWPGQDWFNIVQAELLNVLAAAGITPEKRQLNQLALAIKAIVNDGALLQQNLLGEIKQAGASAQKTARDNLGLGTAAVRDVQATGYDDTAGRALTVGAFGLGSTVSTITNDRLTEPRTFFFRQGGGENDDHFGGYGVGAHIHYAVEQDKNKAGNLYIRPGGRLMVEWRLNDATSMAEVYSTLRKPSAADVNALPLSGGALSGNLEIKRVAPIIKLSETDTGRNYQLIADGGTFRINRDDPSGPCLLQYHPDHDFLKLPPQVVCPMTCRRRKNANSPPRFSLNAPLKPRHRPVSFF